MEPSELAARTILGDLNEPDKHIGVLLMELDARRQVLSGGEQVLVDLGLDFWNGRGGAKVADVLNRLDGENFEHFREALSVKRPVRV